MKLIVIVLLALCSTGCALTADFTESNKCVVDRGMLVETPDGWKVDTRQKSFLEGLVQPDKIEVEM